MIADMQELIEADQKAWSNPARARLHADCIRQMDAALAERGVTDARLREQVLVGVAATRAAQSYASGLEGRFDTESCFDALQSGPLGFLIAPSPKAGELTAEQHRDIAAALPPAQRLNYARKWGLM